MKTTFIILFVFLSQFLAAQQNEIELNPVTITASLQPEPSSATGRNIVSIPGHYFNKLPVHSLDELLRYVPGMEVQMRGPGGSQSDIVLRGGTFQQVLIILDGLRLNDPNTGHFNSYIPIVPAEIERIEVLKGASSAIYGSEAVGGVVHVITRSFQAKNTQAKKQLSAAVTAGEYNLFNGSVGGYCQKNSLAVAGGIISNNSDGALQRGTRGSFHNHTASLSMKKFLSDQWSIALRTSYDQRKFGAQNFYTTFVSDTAEEKVSSSWNQASVNFQKNKHHLSFDAGYKSVRDIFEYNPKSIPNNNRSNLLQLLLTEQYQVHPSTVITAGLQYQERKIHSNDRGNHSLNQAAGFIILHQKAGDFSFSPSVRVDWSEIRGTELIPQINISWHREKWQLRGSAGKTIRDADFTERFNNYNKSFVAGGSIGNPDLKAERSFSYEAGADWLASRHIKLSVSGFQRRQKQLIDWVPTPYSEIPRNENLSPTGNYALAKNIAEVITSGTELDGQYIRSWNRGQSVFISVGLVWLYSDIEKGVPSFYLSSHARLLTNFNVRYSYERISFSVNGIYKYRNPQVAAAINASLSSDYFLCNARADFEILKSRLYIFTEVDNITDHQYSDLLGATMPGRWWMGGIKFSL